MVISGTPPAPRLVYFGPWWDVPALENAVPMPTPDYAQCLRCGEYFVEGDQGLVTPYIGELDPAYLVGMSTGWALAAQHRECQLAEIVGHLVGVCSCSGYGTDRASAKEVLRRVQAGALRDIGDSE